LWSFVIFVNVTIIVSLLTKPVPDSQFNGLVYGLTEVPHIGNIPFYKKPIFWAGVVTVVFLILNIIFW
jgi:SSS family solute:Na+ symporter